MTPLYNAIYRGSLKSATDGRPLQVEEDELVRWILKDFTGPRP